MRTGMLVFALTASGVVGGVVGALLAGGGPAAAPPGGPAAAAVEAPAGPSLSPREWDEIRNRLAALEGNITANAEETNRLRATLEEERRESASLREKVSTLEEGNGFPGAPGGLRFGGRQVGAGGQVDLPPIALSMPERFRKASELRALPEEERWGKARVALGLTSYQEEELKAAIAERAKSVQEAMQVTTAESTSDDGGSSSAITIAMPDMEKMREARKKYDDRVGQALNAEQQKTWRDEGYESALGGGGGGLSFVSTAIRGTAPPVEEK